MGEKNRPTWDPDTTAPAIAARFTSMTLARPIMATPMVPQVPKLVPMKKAVTAVNRNPNNIHRPGVTNASRYVISAGIVPANMNEAVKKPIPHSRKNKSVSSPAF